MKRGYFTDFLGNLVKIGFKKDKNEVKEFFLLKNTSQKECEVELPEDYIEEISNVGFKFNQL